MKILQINAVCGQGSTGRICVGIADLLKANGHEAYIAYGLGNSSYPECFNISTGKYDYFSHNILSRLTDSEGLHSSKGTQKLINFIEDIQPDVVHIHTLHGHYINYKKLFEFLQNRGIPIVITLHDCWLFTGHCAHFDQLGCDKWKIECKDCQFLNAYPQSWFVDNSRRNFHLKRILLTSIGKNLTLVPVSYWLEGLLRQSFLKNMNIQTIHNGIDLDVFRPTYNEKLLQKYNLMGKKIIIGVALPWSSYKGFPDFIKLRSLLSNDYAIIMVGLSEKQMNEIPQGIIGITRTNSTKELAELYTIADVLVNTTYCDNYPTVNLEAIACGTPVITYNTGGSPEAVDQYTGIVVSQGNIGELVNAIHTLLRESNVALTQKCRERALSNFDKKVCFLSYVDLYKKIIKG